jgi:outer membrane cobalamin receptor
MKAAHRSAHGLAEDIALPIFARHFRSSAPLVAFQAFRHDRELQLMGQRHDGRRMRYAGFFMRVGDEALVDLDRFEGNARKWLSEE